MAAEFDTTEFIDADFQMNKSSYTEGSSSFASTAQRAPSREEVDSKVAEAQQKLAELKRAQEELERERAALEETRRRHMEFQNGRQEMLQNLIRGVGILEEAEFAARRDAEQMAKSLGELREALSKVQAIQEDVWTKSEFHAELTRALTSIENARMEWNTARLKFPVLSGHSPAAPSSQPLATGSAQAALPTSFIQLCRFGLAMTWPLAAIGLASLGLLAFALLHH
jgi:chromosome segregation ATPase